MLTRTLTSLVKALQELTNLLRSTEMTQLGGAQTAGVTLERDPDGAGLIGRCAACGGPVAFDDNFISWGDLVTHLSCGFSVDGFFEVGERAITNDERSGGS